MPGITYELSGLDKLTERLKTGLAAARQEAKAELYQFAEEIMSDSKEVVPMLTGNLAATGHVGRHTSDGAGVEEGPVYEDGNQIMVDIGYGGPAAGYALYVHEALEGTHEINPNWSWAKAVAAGKEIQWTRPGSGPMYLARPLRAKQEQLPGRITAAFKRGLLGQ